MARIRVFLCTYRRPHLLRRALRSLLDQTFSDWVCEVRNDAPDDSSPAAIIREAADPRLHYLQHKTNLGGVRLFNEVFSEQAEPFVALLEDDNWWEPQFLERMVAVLEQNPKVTLAWSNQKIWEESAAGDWSNTGRLARPASADPAPTLACWPHPFQCFGALHANGAMLLRTRPGKSYPTPLMEFGGTEGVRERSLPHPLIYVPEPLAVFSVTRVSHRSRDATTWATNQVLLAATFMKHVSASSSFWESLWRRAREASPRMTGSLLLAVHQDPTLRRYLVHAKPDDWRHLAVRSVQRPFVFLQLRRARKRAPAMWDFLDTHTASRAVEHAANPGPTGSPQLFLDR